MEHVVNQMGLGDDVRFAGIVRDREILVGAYLAASLFVFPSTYDTFAIVVREAAALGCPSILIRGQNAADGIEDGVTGFLCGNSAEDLAESICAAVNNRELLRTVGDNASRMVSMPWSKVCDMAYNRYAELVDSYKSAKKPAGRKYFAG